MRARRQVLSPAVAVRTQLAGLALLLLVGLAAVLILLLYAAPATLLIWFEAAIEAWGLWGVLLSIGLMILHSFIPFPAELLAIANGMLFGPVWGTIITWSGAMLGAAAAFAASRVLGRPFVEAVLARNEVVRLDQLAGEQAVHWLFLARFVPVIAFNLVNYAAGLTAISWWTFMWTTGLGILPLTTIMVVMGAEARTLEWWWWLALMAAGFVLWLLLRRALRAHAAQSS